MQQTVHKVIIQSKSTRGQDNLISNNLGNEEIKMVITKENIRVLLCSTYSRRDEWMDHGWMRRLIDG